VRTRGTRTPPKTPEPIFEFQADSRTIKRSAFHSVLLQVFLRLKGVITLPLITYLMMPEELGVFNLIVNTASFFVPLLTLNLTDGPVLYFVRETDKGRLSHMYSTVFNATFLSSAAGFLVIYALMRFVPSLGTLKPYFFSCILMYMSLHLFKVTSYVLVIYQKTDRMIYYSAWNELGGVALGLLLVWWGLSYKGLVAGNLVAAVLVAAWLFRLFLKEIRYYPRVNLDYFRQFLAISLPLLPVFIFSWIMQSLDSYFLAFYQGTEAVGQYAVIYSICRIILATSMALNFFWYPVSVKLWQEAREKYLHYFKLLVSGGLPLLLLILLLFEANSRLLVFVFARKPEYQTIYPYLSLIAFAFVMQVMITIVTAPLYANENPRWIFLANFSGGALKLLLNLALIPRYGLWGASISTALSYLLVVAILTYATYRVCRFPFLEKRCLSAASVALLVWAALFVSRDRLAVASGLWLSAVLSLLLPALAYLFYMRPEERVFLKELRYRLLKTLEGDRAPP